MESTYISLDPESIKNVDFYNSISDIIKCSICHNILLMPVTCNSCENHFCKNCVSNWVKVNKSDTACPFKCSKNEFKSSQRVVTSLLDKLIFKCNCNSESFKDAKDEVLYSYTDFIKHISKDCKNFEIECICNGKIKYLNFCKSNLFSEFVALKDKNKYLTSQYNDLKVMYDEANKKLELKIEEIKKLKEEINTINISNTNNTNNTNNTGFNNNYIVNNTSNISNNNNNIKKNVCKSVQDINFAEYYNLYDKCKHFKGNYLPIFSCCDKSYPCYLCHQEENNHTIILSNKVICMNCKEIYSGNQCPCCNEFQLYKKKGEN